MEQLLAQQTSCWPGRLRLLGQDHPDTLAAMSGAAATMRGLHMAPADAVSPLEQKVLHGKLMLATHLERPWAVAWRKLHGPDHPDTLGATTNVAVVLEHCPGQLAVEIELMEEVLGARLLQLGPIHLDTPLAKYDLSKTLPPLGQPARAQELQQEVLAARTWLLGPGHLDTIHVTICLACSLRESEKLQHSHPAAGGGRGSLAHAPRGYAPTHP
jgi:hypothetical protein